MHSREIGARVSKVREARKLSTVHLAEKVGISQAQISRLENGKQGFRSSTLVRIAEALSTPPFYFLMTDNDWEAYQLGRAKKGQPPAELLGG